MVATDYAILNVLQRRKMILGKVFNMQHELYDIIFKDSFDNRFNNFINLYERSRRIHDAESLLYEVSSDFKSKVYLQWKHGKRSEEGYPMGLRFPSYISYVKGPTQEKDPHKIVDVDRKNMDKFVDEKTLGDYDVIIAAIEKANLGAKLIPIKSVADLHDIIDRIGGLLHDEFSRYSWVGGVFWGGKGFSYWGDWNSKLMDDLAETGFIDIQTNTGEFGYHAQRLCSPQIYKPTMVTNYLCRGSYDSFKFCCPAFFMIKGETLSRNLDEYHKDNFITTYKSKVSFDRIMKWQDEGIQDMRLWEHWRDALRKKENEIKSLVFMSEK